MKFIILILFISFVCGNIVGKAALSALICFGTVDSYSQLFGNLIPGIFDESLVYWNCIPILTTFEYDSENNNNDSFSSKCILHNYNGDCLSYESN